MNKLEQAARQALEALESAPVQYDFNSYPMLVMTPDTLQTTLTALREALAEQAEQEPVAVITSFYPEGIEWFKCVREGTKLYAAPVDAKAIRAEALEEAAKMAEAYVARGIGLEMAAAIRGLK